MKRLHHIALSLLLLLASCGPVLSALPTVITAVVDAMQIIDMIEQHAELVLAQTNADAATKTKVHEAIARARGTLNAALRVAQGAEHAGQLDQASADAAFAAFKEAYLSLLEVVQPLGIREAGDTLSARASISGTTLTVPRPEAFRLQVRRAD
jgi:hypothetical protein